MDVARRRRVLVVDDDPSVRALLNTMLSLEGLEVAEAADGVAALGLADVMRPDVILLDIMMPRMDGYEVCRALKERPDPPKVVMVTAKTAQEDELAALAAGADGYIRKPFSPAQILRAVDAAPAPEGNPVSELE